MPAPDLYDGAPCWIDLITSDSEKAKKFYGELFGWTFESGDQEKYGGYITASKHGKTVAGMMQKQTSQAGMPDVWTTYLRTDRRRSHSRSREGTRRPGFYGADGGPATGTHGASLATPPARQSASGSPAK